MRLCSLVLLAQHLSTVYTTLLNGATKDLVLEFVRNTQSSSLVVFSCLQEGDNVQFTKFLSSHSVVSQFVSQESVLDESHLLAADVYHLPVVVDLSCEASSRFLEQASTSGQMRGLHYWLILEADVVFLEDALSPLPLVLDSHVTTALRAEDSESVLLREVYRTGVGQPLTWTTPQYWLPGDRIHAAELRHDLQGITLRTVNVELEDDWSHHDDLRYKHLNTWNKIFYVLVRQLSVKYNFHMRERMANTWGYMKDGKFDGMVGMLQRGEADMGSAGIIIKKYRLFAIDVTAEVTTFRPKFVFRQPRLSAVTNIYLLPFSRGVWATYLSTLVLLTAVVVGVDKCMKKYMPPTRNGDQSSMWSDVIFRAMGILCDEELIFTSCWAGNPLIRLVLLFGITGDPYEAHSSTFITLLDNSYPDTPESLSSRIVLLFLLILSVFHVTSYGACVVSLLQTPSTGYDTLEELLDSPIKMAMQDIPYNVAYINETDSPIVHRIFKERLYTVPHKQAFMPLNEGVERVRHGMFAFHVDISAYKYIKDTYLEDEKCGLKEVPLFQTQMLSVPIAKNSPYKELVTRGLRWQREIGLIDRELKRWTTSKPECTNRDSSFVSVGLQEFSPVLMVLCTGIGISMALFLMENLVFNIQKCHSTRKDLMISLRN